MSEYSDNQKARNKKHLEENLLRFPTFCKGFFYSVEPSTQSTTWIAYCNDLRRFFAFLCDVKFAGKKMSKLTIEDIQMVNDDDITLYVQYLTYGKILSVSDQNLEIINKEYSVSRRLSTLRTFFAYLYGKKLISSDPAVLVHLPKHPEKEVITLDKDEVAELLDVMNTGDMLTKQQKAFYEKTRLRDITIISLLLDTGLRVSECVGLDISSVNIIKCRLENVHRKENKEVNVSFSDKMKDLLQEYLDWRKHTSVAELDEKALFVSLQGTRISVRSVERLVKKFSQLIGRNDITPHKLRATYATSFYRTTHDTELTAQALSHSGLGAVKKYIKAADDALEKARNITSL